MSRFARSVRSKRSTAAIPEITLTPLIDTALTLLIIFMVTSPMIHNGIRVDLPKGQAKEVQGVKEELVIHIDKNSKLFLNEVAYADEQQLIGALQKKVKTQKNGMVFIKGDGDNKYKTVLEFVDRIKLIEGIERVALATSPKVT